MSMSESSSIRNHSETFTGKKVAIVGGGPAGLMAAEVLTAHGVTIGVYESMPTLGRKFLRAGLGGLNITHSEPFKLFCTRYGDQQRELQPFLDAFPPNALREWVHELGIQTFVGTSGRVFPTEMKAAPLLRTWVHRLRASGVNFHFNHRWLGFNPDGTLRLASGTEELRVQSDAVILALGGASWPQLGSTGTWLALLQERGVETSDWESANCGFDVQWSPHLRETFDGAPLKAVALTYTDLSGKTERRTGELLIKEYGIEGGLIYSFSKRLRECIAKHGNATFMLDLLPDRSADRVLADLSKPRGSKSVSRYLQNCLGNNTLKKALLYEFVDRRHFDNPAKLAKYIKALPIKVLRPRPIEEAISTAGGVRFNSVDNNLMLKSIPGVFVAGEMLDWEAPTGGYLLTACFATGRGAGLGVINWFRETSS